MDSLKYSSGDTGTFLRFVKLVTMEFELESAEQEEARGRAEHRFV